MTVSAVGKKKNERKGMTLFSRMKLKGRTSIQILYYVCFAKMENHSRILLTASAVGKGKNEGKEMTL